MARLRLGLAWNPDWFHAHESLWSALGKLATVNLLDVPGLRWVSKAMKSLDSNLWLPIEKTDAVELMSALDIPLPAAKTAFLFDLVPEPQDRVFISRGVRYCPLCLEHGFHSSLFQHLLVVRCPVHGSALEDACPRCKMPFSPAADHPWRCNSCGRTIAIFAGETWLKAFKWGPPDVVLSALRRALMSKETSLGALGHINPFPAGYLQDPVGYRGFLRGDSARVRLPLPGDAFTQDFQYWRDLRNLKSLARWCHEEAEFLINTVFLDHLPCYQRDFAKFGMGSPLKSPFECQISATIRDTLAYLGHPSDPAGEFVPNKEVQSAIEGHVVSRLYSAEANGLLTEAHASFIARAVARAYVADTLAGYVTGQRIGPGRWRPFTKMDYQVSWKAQESLAGWALELQTDVTIDTLRNLVARANCGYQHGAKLAAA